MYVLIILMCMYYVDGALIVEKLYRLFYTKEKTRRKEWR